MLKSNIDRLCNYFNLAILIGSSSSTLRLPVSVIFVCCYTPPDGSIGYGTEESNGKEMLKAKLFEVRSLCPDDLLLFVVIVTLELVKDKIILVIGLRMFQAWSSIRVAPSVLIEIQRIKS